MTAPSGAASTQASAVRQAYYDRIAEHNLAPLWERLRALITRSPRSAAQPIRWRFATVRPHLLASGELLSAEEAERRVLVLENPGLAGQSQVTGSLYAGLQLLLPGERAHPHRHTATALRLILEGSKGYTTVNEERMPMARGDFIITPSWTWHEHGNDGTDPVIWLDGLDVPIINLFETSFAEDDDADSSPSLPRPEGAARDRAALPTENASSGPLSSPVLSYGYQQTREALAALYRNGGVDRCHGVKLPYVNPVTGGSVMPTMSAALQLLPAGFETAPYRSTDGSVFVVVEGKGSSHVGETAFDWTENDIFVVPSWFPQRHAAESEAVLFSFSDRTAQEKLGIWREHRGDFA